MLLNGRVFAGLLLCLVFTSSAFAYGPALINFQARLTDPAGAPLAPNDSVTFSIYDAPVGGNLYWSERRPVASDSNGFISVLLGSITAFTPAAFGGSDRYLGIRVKNDPEPVPRTRLAASPWAAYVQSLDGASGGRIQGGTTVIANSQYPYTAVQGSSSALTSANNIGVLGHGFNSTAQNIGVYGLATDANSISNSAAIYGHANSVSGGSIWAGYFNGWVNVTGTFSAGAKFFKVDDPIDPANRTLQHACVESSEYKNMYDGVATTDATGNAVVRLPEWFEALNKDFRYQLTVIGQFAQAIVSKEIAHNQFTIASDKPNVKISWLVTGVRKDAYALAHPFEVRQMKADALRGKYLQPKEHGLDESMGVDYAMSKEVESQIKAKSGE